MAQNQALSYLQVQQIDIRDIVKIFKFSNCKIKWPADLLYCGLLIKTYCKLNEHISFKSFYE